MTALSSAGWIVHDVGLATSIGGSMFGKFALEPALDEVGNPIERDHASEDAWRRFSWLNLASHAAFAIPWLIGRSMLSGREVSGRARALTRVKDVLVGASLITGVASIVLGRVLGAKARRNEGPEASADQRARGLERAVSIAGLGNLLSTAGIAIVTTLLAMEGNKSLRFSATTKCLP